MRQLHSRVARPRFFCAIPRSLASPSLGERGHRGLARRLVAVRRCAVVVMTEGRRPQTSLEAESNCIDGTEKKQSDDRPLDNCDHAAIRKAPGLDSFTAFPGMFGSVLGDLVEIGRRCHYAVGTRRSVSVIFTRGGRKPASTTPRAG